MPSTGVTRPRARLRATTVVAAALVLMLGAGCERRAATPRNDTAVPVVPPPESAAAPEPSTTPAWDSTAAGPVLVVPAAAPQEALVIVPAFTEGVELDTAHVAVQGVQGRTMDLFGRGRMVGRATVASTTPAERVQDCATWPSARLAPAAGGGIAPWTVGFLSGRAEPVATDSIEGLASADSSRLVTEIARLASSLPNDTARSFRGLPFVVRSVRRFEAAPGVEAIVAEVVRKLSIEASPKQEQILVIAERDSASGGAWTPLHVERQSGTEDELETDDVLAVVRLGGSRRPTIVLRRELGEGATYSLLERTSSPPGWRVRWTSAYAGC